MSEFSDKYKCAVESREISPDFKERTAEKMKKLRDAAPAPRKNITLYRVVSAAAAAAACLTAGFAINRTGVLDKASQPPAVEEQTTTAAYVTETEITLSERLPEEETLLEEGALREETLREESSQTAAPFRSYTEEEAPAADNAAAADEINVTTAAVTTAAPAAVFSETTAETLPAVPAEELPAAVAAPAVTSPESSSAESGKAENSLSDHLVLEPAAYPYEDQGGEVYEEEIEAAEEPACDEYEQDAAAETEIPDGDMYGSYGLLPVEAVPDEEENIISTGAFYAESTEVAADAAEVTAGSGVVSEIIKAAEFSAGDTMSAFKAQDSTAVITPAFEDFDPESGSVVIYKPKKIRNVKKLMELSGKLCEYARDGEASLKTAAPSDSRYIIDYRSRQGDAVRICVGSGYIAFAYKGGHYSFTLTDDEYSSLNDELFEMIK